MASLLSYFVYVLRCSDKSLYTGFTTDVDRRVDEHNKGVASKYTRTRLPVTLVYKEQLRSKSDALKREHAIKKLTRTEKMKLIGLLGLLLCLVVTACTPRTVQIPAFLGTKTPYVSPVRAESEILPRNCVPVHVEGLFRHGSRYINKQRYIDDLIEILSDAKGRSTLTAKGEKLLLWTRAMLKDFKAGKLTAQGEEELFGLGQRMARNHGQLLVKGAPVLMTSATKARAQQSRAAFARGVASIGAAEISLENPNDGVLRFFDKCESYKEYKDGAMRDLIAHASEGLLTHSVTAAAEALIRKPSEDVSWSIADSLYALCQQDYNIDKQDAENRFCAQLPSALKEVQSQRANIKSFYKLGPAANNGMACAVLEPMFDRMQRAVTKKSVVAAHFTFAHAETVVPVSDFFEIFSRDFKDWKVSEAGPMAANVQMITYACGDAYKVKMLYNENPKYFAIPECANSYYCDYRAVKAYYEKRKRALGMRSCSDFDWAQGCAAT